MDEILNLIESVSEGFPSYLYHYSNGKTLSTRYLKNRLG